MANYNITAEDFLSMYQNGFYTRNSLLGSVRNSINRYLNNQIDDSTHSSIKSAYNWGNWQVVQSNQLTIQALMDETVYIDDISKHRVGTQSARQVYVSRAESEKIQSTLGGSVEEYMGWWECMSWFEEWLIQISAFKSRMDTSSVISDSASSADLITFLMACFNKQDRTTFSRIKTSEMREVDFETDSGLKEKMPQFDIAIVVPQVVLVNRKNATVGDVNVHGI